VVHAGRSRRRRKGASARILSPAEARHRDEMYRRNRARPSIDWADVFHADELDTDGARQLPDDFGLGDAIAREREARRKTDLARAGTHYDPAY
jgi:hypothetical protein